MGIVEHWRRDENARMYAEFARRHPMYRRTSEDLVARAGLRPDSNVLDLACGTGVTTEAVLAHLGPSGRVLAVDASPAMLRIAREHVRDSRVSWLEAEAETLGTTALRAGGFDAIVCNSAIWQLGVEPVATAVADLLRPGGRFVCNLGTRQRETAPAAAAADALRSDDAKPSLYDLMRAYAVIDHGFVHEPSPTAPSTLTDERLRDVLSARGLCVDAGEIVEYPFDLDQTYAWMRIPIFTEQFTGLTYAQRMDALDKAYARVDRRPGPASRWLIVRATRPESGTGVRAATSSDSGEIYRLLRQLHPDAPPTATLPSVRQTSETFVATLDGEVAGVVVVASVDYGLEAYGTVEELVVDVGHRGVGIGTALLERCRAWFVDAGVAVVFVSAADEAAARFYLSSGFRLCTGPWLYTSP